MWAVRFSGIGEPGRHVIPTWKFTIQVFHVPPADEAGGIVTRTTAYEVAEREHDTDRRGTCSI
jgi:hypothetical protein